jgi:CRP-like cAMP-binding protein
MAIPSDLSHANRLLAALPSPERSSLLAQCELVEFKAHSVLLAAGEPMTHAWFAVEGMVCQVLPMEHEQSMEVGLVGHEGMFSTSLVLGAACSAFTYRAQGAGRAFCISRAQLLEHLRQAAPLQQVLQGHAELCHRHLARQLACLKHHSVPERLARWLLMVRDRAHASELFLTHEALAWMLSARRESVTHSARRLQQRGLISYSRGYMMLLDEPALALAACPCYQADVDSYEAWWRTVAHTTAHGPLQCGLATAV